MLKLNHDFCTVVMRLIWCPGSQNNLGWQLPRHYRVSHAYSKVLADKQNNYGRLRFYWKLLLLPLLCFSTLLSCQIFMGSSFCINDDDDWEILIDHFLVIVENYRGSTNFSIKSRVCWQLHSVANFINLANFSAQK